MSEVTDKAERAIARADRVMALVDERGGSVGEARARERKRALARYGRALTRATLAVLVIFVLTVAVGLFKPIGMIGFLAAVAIAMTIGAMLFLNDAFRDGAPTVPKDADNGEMVQRFDSFLYRSRRALPAPAQPVLDSISANLGTLKTTLERVDPLDPDAQDARRLMSVHMPGLIERYANVPPAFRGTADGDGVTVDQRLVEGLEASREALADVSERLAKRDVDAFQTQGRFIQSRYGDAGPRG